MQNFDTVVDPVTYILCEQIAQYANTTKKRFKHTVRQCGSPVSSFTWNTGPRSPDAIHDMNTLTCTKLSAGIRKNYNLFFKLWPIITQL